MQKSCLMFAAGVHDNTLTWRQAAKTQPTDAYREEYGAGCRWFMTWRRDKEIDKHALLYIVGFAVAFTTSFV